MPNPRVKYLYVYHKLNDSVKSGLFYEWELFISLLEQLVWLKPPPQMKN